VKNEEIKLSNKEIKFLQNNEICRVATSYNDIPHVVPVCYIFGIIAYFCNRLSN
jgi:nitroimidazol reductase NimA-like FMN-containing flavoprotein (pyridoxamine 5'-phosphate oxidase superfamily)